MPYTDAAVQSYIDDLMYEAPEAALLDDAAAVVDVKNVKDEAVIAMCDTTSPAAIGNTKDRDQGQENLQRQDNQQRQDNKEKLIAASQYNAALAAEQERRSESASLSDARLANIQSGSIESGSIESMPASEKGRRD